MKKPLKYSLIAVAVILIAYFVFVQKYSYAKTCVPVVTSNPTKTKETLWTILMDKYSPCSVA